MKPLDTHVPNVEPSSVFYEKQILFLQLITLVWLGAEAAVGLWAAIRAHSMALVGFGADSGIELASGLVVFLRFRTRSRISETKAARVTGLLLFALAAFIVGSSIVALTNPRFRPEPSYVGIALLIASAFAMPWLAVRKRILAGRTKSASLKADAVQSSMCGYLAWIALGGLALNALFKLWWADPLAALLLLPIVVREGWTAMRGESCSDGA